MNIKLVTTSRLAGALVLPVAGHVATDSDSGRSWPKVKVEADN